MSGTSYSQDCPECGSKDSLLISSDWKPYESASGGCLECGFTYWTVEGQMKLKEVNYDRENCCLKPLKKLKKRKK